jgi:DNA primase
MAGPRYAREHLFALRNHIPIDRLIGTMAIPSKNQEGCYRFQCPVCNEFNTGMNPKTNLARCFTCRKNYNTIDLVMTVKGLSFIDSVAYLEKIKTTILFPAKKAHDPAPTPSRSRDTVKSSKPVALGDIFKSLATSTPNTSPQLQDNERKTIEDLQKRVSVLENHVKFLTEKIELIELR